MSSRSAVHGEIDASIIHRIAEGDALAFDAFYGASVGVLYAMGMRMLQHPEDVEELLQDVYMKIWQDAGQYDARRGAPLAWAITITRNRAIDRIRSNARRSNLQDAAAKETDPAVAAPPAADHAESSRAVHDSVSSLAPEVRETVELAYFGGLSQSQIARKLSVPLTTVKSRIRTAMTRLRQTLKPYA